MKTTIISCTCPQMAPPHIPITPVMTHAIYNSCTCTINIFLAHIFSYTTWNFHFYISMVSNSVFRLALRVGGCMVDEGNVYRDHVRSSWSAVHGQVWNHWSTIRHSGQEGGGVSVCPGRGWLLMGSLVEQGHWGG